MVSWVIWNTRKKFYFERIQQHPKIILDGAIGFLEEYRRLCASQNRNQLCFTEQKLALIQLVDLFCFSVSVDVLVVVLFCCYCPTCWIYFMLYRVCCSQWYFCYTYFSSIKYLSFIPKIKEKKKHILLYILLNPLPTIRGPFGLNESGGE